ncbi:conjugal transfer protein TraN [Novosphingobium pentaromativorans]|uniref:Mating pair stabilization TraN family protein n=1 Tax=Novosphingobium pentaromativorans US6-1 TaxID=1088721 RepID=G6EK25_9SPHN|nr:conjugal transfer protein TraN [Novosphingobium pentaromativorans]AIT82497.1 conjugal transfer protein TraN [Novosphingobium pentaromativorans US6-1]EHJ58364.1 mating pair stabilization TraN family protein [Novosphingobium pentaromativorans US6-1]
MKAAVLLLAALAWASAISPASAQMTLEEARQQGKAMGNDARQNDTLVPTTNAQAEAVPGYAGTSLPEGSYFDSPERLEAAAQSSKSSNEQYRIATDAERTRPTFSNAEIRATTARATSVEDDPSTYLAGEEFAGESGTCTPLPPGSGTQGSYEATCNSGTKVVENPASCSIRMMPEVSTVESYNYYVVPDSAYGTPFARSATAAPYISSGVCKPTGVIKRACAAHLDYGWPWPDNKYCNGYNATEYECTANLAIAMEVSPKTGASWHTKSSASTVITKKVDTCGGLEGDDMCTLQSAGDICTEGPETRVFDGVPVTEACWAWKRDYLCNRLAPANDCTALEANAGCTFLRTECLDDEPDGGPCKVEERVYRCPTPGGTSAETPQYICGNDVYCINGDCEPIVREASTEFKDALVALRSIDQAGKEFDETNFTVFKGNRETCQKPVFGLINCCAGKVSGVLTVGAGAAALAGGPAALAALATPFLTLFACSQDEMKLDIRDRMGFCHKVGTYCSSSFLGICKTKRTAYCCFESKLSRILQEQGRIQLGRPWGAPKREQCLGFTIDEFSQLDLSIMDFTEVYAEFVDAARLPDEVETMTQIQQKIQDYYDLRGK